MTFEYKFDKGHFKREAVSTMFDEPIFTMNTEEIEIDQGNFEIAGAGQEARHRFMEIPQGDEAVRLLGENERNGKDKRVFTTFPAVLYSIGTMVGSGIFITPGIVYTFTTSYEMTIIYWIAGGIFNLLGSLLYASLGEICKTSGAEYTYLRRSLGLFPSYMYALCSAIIIRPTSIAANLLLFSKSLMFVINIDYKKEEFLHISIVFMIIIVAILLFSSVQHEWTKTFNLIMAAITILGILVFTLIGTMSIVLFPMEVQNSSLKIQLEDHSNPTCKHESKNVGIMLFYVLYSYSGWKNVSAIRGQLENARKTIFWTMIFGVCIVIGLYSLFITVLFKTVNVEEITCETIITFEFFKEMSRTFRIPLIQRLGPLIICASSFGTAVSLIYSYTYVQENSVQDGCFPKILTKRHPFGEESKIAIYPITLLMLVFSLIYFFYFEYSTMIVFSQIFVWIFYIFSAVILLNCRAEKSFWHRLPPLVFIIGGLILHSIALLQAFHPVIVSSVMGCIAFYITFHVLRFKKNWFLNDDKFA